MAGRRNSKEKRRCTNTYKRLVTTNYKDTQTHRLTLTKDSYDLELFEEQVNFLSIVMEYTLQTVKGKDCQNACTIGINDASHLPRLDSSRITLHRVPSSLVYVSLRKVEDVLA